MADAIVSYYENYMPGPDVLVIALSLIFFILTRTSYINKTKSYLYLRHMIMMACLAAIFNLTFHVCMNNIGVVPRGLIYIFRSLYHMTFLSNLYLYVLYFKESAHIKFKQNILYFSLASVTYIFILFYEIISTITHTGFYIDKNGGIHTGFPMFPAGYIFYIVLLLILLVRFRKRFYKRIVLSIVGTVFVSILVIVIQQFYDQSSYTTATLLFPLFSLLYMVHSNPYDLATGSVNELAFEERVSSGYQRKENLYFMSLYLRDYDGKMRKYPAQISEAIRNFTAKFFKDATLFTITSGHMIMVIDIKKNPNYVDGGRRMLEEFSKVYEIYKLDYKIVYTGSNETLSKENDYIGFIRYLLNKMPENTVIITNEDEKEIKDYEQYKYILKQLEDINNKADLDDERVLVYCQPVLNIKKNKYDTAEALMRLRLDGKMVFPDQFIPLAEMNGSIIMLSKIILHKTCLAVKKLNEDGYFVKRVSVNFSLQDVRNDRFCDTVKRIIDESGIEPRQIAVELTETQNESDFELIKERINSLKDSGIKFYLDDFGTGYSNFERIMELPFDIVKFDRSLVIGSGNDEKLKTIVTNLAKMFRDVDYAVLYEGVEDDTDENRCINMSATYLQGYKYSKPIPIEQLSEYFSKEQP